MERFFSWWSGRIYHIFTGEKRQENFFQKLLTFHCVICWKFWFCMLALCFFALQFPWPIIGSRVVIRGRENVKNIQTENCLGVPNHGSLMSPPLAGLSWMLAGGAWSLYQVLKNPCKYFVWQTPNKKVMKDVFMLIGRMSPVIIVESDERGMPNDAGALRGIIKRGKKNTIITFVEGTRSGHAREPKIKTQSGVVIGYPFWGAGLLIYHNRPIVIPILIKGEREIWPDGAPLWTAVKNLLFSKKHLEIIFGKQMDISFIHERNKKIKTDEVKEIARVISERVVREIAAMDTTG